MPDKQAPMTTTTRFLKHCVTAVNDWIKVPSHLPPTIPMLMGMMLMGQTKN